MLQSEIIKREEEIRKLNESLRTKDTNLAMLTVTENINKDENKSFLDLLSRKDK